MDAKPSSNLLHVPLVIIRIILEDLHCYNLGDFFNFRLVSRACRTESEFLLFRSIVLSDDTLAARTESLNLAKKILDVNGIMREYVKHLRFGPFTDTEWFYSDISPLLEGVLRSIKHLQSFTWNMNPVIRPGMIDLFYKQHPTANLHVIVRDRNLMPLNRDLLSSSQLHTLDILVYRVQPANAPDRSELPLIKECLGTSLRVLRLYIKEVWYDDQRRQLMEWETVQPGPSFFDWHEGDRFGPLEELTMEYDKYHLTRDNCDMWAKVMSWNRLQKLDLDKGSPRHFFASLTDRAVNLKSLKFWISSPRKGTWDLHPLNTGLPILTKFIASIISLQELEFGAYASEEFSSVLLSILKNTRGSLRALNIQCRAWGMASWSPEQYISILDQTLGLEVFQAKINNDRVEGYWKGFESRLSSWEKFNVATINIEDLPELHGRPRPQHVGRLI